MVEKVVVILYHPKIDKFILIKHKDYPHYSLVQGTVEKHEKPHQTAIREAYEETGSKVSKLEKVKTFKTNDKIYHLFYAIVEGKLKPEKKYLLEEGIHKIFLTKKIPFQKLRHLHAKMIKML